MGIAIIRPQPLFAPVASGVPYRASRRYLPGSEWVGQGLGTAHRWWRGEPVLVVDGNPAVLATLDPDEQPDGVIQTGAHTAAGLQLVWRLVDDETPEADRYANAYAERMATYAERRGLDALEDGDYVLTSEVDGRDALMPRLSLAYLDAPRDYDGIKAFLDREGIFGLLWADHGAEVGVLRSDFLASIWTPAASDGTPA